MVREAAVVRSKAASAKQPSRRLPPREIPLLPKKSCARLREKLPSHLLPNRFFSLADMPLLPSGKVNRQQLVQRAAANSEVSSRYYCPTDTIELQLVRIWESVLRIECVTVDDDFFALGGDSLAAAALFAAVEKFFNVDLPVSTLLHAPTIKLLAEAIKCAAHLMSIFAWLHCNWRQQSAALLRAGFFFGLQSICRFSRGASGLSSPSSRFNRVDSMAGSRICERSNKWPRIISMFCASTSHAGRIAFVELPSAASSHLKWRALSLRKVKEFPFLVCSILTAAIIRDRERDLSLRKKIKVAMRRSRAGGVKTFSEWWQRLLVRLDMKFGFRPLPRPYPQRFLYLQEACFAARRHYSLRPFNGRIYLFRLEAQPNAKLYEVDPFLGWRGAAAGGIEVQRGAWPARFSLERNPTSAIWLKKLARCLSHAKGARLEFEPCIKC